MGIKNEEFEIEVSHGNDVYFGSRKSEPIFKRLEDKSSELNIRIKSIAILVEELIKEYKVECCPLKNDKLSILDVKV